MLGLSLYLIPLRLAFDEHTGGRLDVSRAYGKWIRLHQRWRGPAWVTCLLYAVNFNVKALIIVLQSTAAGARSKSSPVARISLSIFMFILMSRINMNNDCLI